MKFVAPAVLFAAISLGCATNPAANSAPRAPEAPAAVSAPASATFDAALSKLVAHDKASDWTEASCAEVAKAFDDIAAASKAPAAASFNAGLTYQRCGDLTRARARFERALIEEPTHAAARAQLALDRYRRDKDVSAAIAALERSVVDAKFQSAPLLVHLATLEMIRSSPVSGPGCKDDMDCAKLNLHRALAIDDAYMPAYSELALYYVRRAKGPAGLRRVDAQQLELAALVCSQAMKKDAAYAPIHNMAGLVQSELGHPSGAAAEFAEAVRLDPRLFEAHMNQGALNLGFRGFALAEEAYRKAVALRPSDYDAHLGLALALRGAIIEGADYERRVAAVQAELDETKKIDPGRPDAWFNEGVLIHEFKTKEATSSEVLAALARARSSYERFVEKAQGKTEYGPTLLRARQRIADIDDSAPFMRVAP